MVLDTEATTEVPEALDIDTNEAAPVPPTDASLARNEPASTEPTDALRVPDPRDPSPLYATAVPGYQGHAVPPPYPTSAAAPPYYAYPPPPSPWMTHPPAASSGGGGPPPQAHGMGYPYGYWHPPEYTHGDPVTGPWPHHQIEGVGDSALVREAAGIAGWNGGDEPPDPLPHDVVQRLHAKQRRPKKKHESDAAQSLMLLQTNEDDDAATTTDATTLNRIVAAVLAVPEPTVPLETEWADLVEECDILHTSLRGDVPDSAFVCVAQFRACGLTQDDRVGKYKNRPLHFTGLCCRFCQGQPGFGRYFPSSYDSFLNGTNYEGILKHIKSDCRACPPRVRNTVLELEDAEKKLYQLECEGVSPDDEAAAAAAPTVVSNAAPVHRPVRPKYGSRKRFFSYIWKKLREIQCPAPGSDEAPAAEETGNEPNDVDATNLDSDPFSLAELLADSPVVSIEDRHLVSDTTLVAMAQMMVCVVTPDDKIGRCKDHTLGFKGLCCKHCGGKAGKPGYGRYFPSSLRSLAQADSCQQMVRHVASKCAHCPPEIRSVVIELSQNEEKNVSTGKRIKYGSRKMFFRRVWTRLHGDIVSPDGFVLDAANEPNAGSMDGEANDKAESMTYDKKPAPVIPGDDDDIPIPWDRVIGDSQVVSLSDRGLISDAQLAAIAQMNLCKLTEADRIGWFKNRSIGFGGLCCKHCGGRPSFGRYFPNSVRSFAQTTSSQTIISHVALYCQECPQDIRDIVTQLQRKENYSDEGSVTLSSSMYGSRKVFFDRAWARMHQKSAVDIDASVATGGPPIDSPNVADEEASKKRAVPDSDFDHDASDEFVADLDAEDAARTDELSTKRLKTDAPVTMEVAMV